MIGVPLSHPQPLDGTKHHPTPCDSWCVVVWACFASFLIPLRQNPPRTSREPREPRRTARWRPRRRVEAQGEVWGVRVEAAWLGEVWLSMCDMFDIPDPGALGLVGHASPLHWKRKYVLTSKTRKRTYLDLMGR